MTDESFRKGEPPFGDVTSTSVTKEHSLLRSRPPAEIEILPSIELASVCR